MPTRRPNILLLMSDQHRGDCLGIEGTRQVRTPNLDSFGASGVRFRHAYSSCPSCVPIRRSLLTGQFPSTHGMVGQCGASPDWFPDGTLLPEAFSRAGYHTALIGRDMHLPRPPRRFGYDLVDSLLFGTYRDALQAYAASVGTNGVALGWRDGNLAGVPGGTLMEAHGIGGNSALARPWHLPEHLHPTQWTVDRALRFLREERDPACPFFLTVSFHAPHPPLVPPACYYDRYMRHEPDPPSLGRWASPPPNGGRGQDLDTGRWLRLEGETLRSCQAGYYGLINHLDDQIQRVLRAVPGDTYIIYTTDHGELLGDHYLFRKCLPYEGAARIPFLVRGPDIARDRVSDAPVGLEDVMPTLLDLAGLPIPESVDGQSLAPLLRENKADGLRAYHHIEKGTLCPLPPDAWREHAPDCVAYETGYHCLTDGAEKYVWFTESGREQFFDLAADPGETVDLADDPARRDTVAAWRARLVEKLRDRPEGFVRDGALVPGRPYPHKMAHLKEA